MSSSSQPQTPSPEVVQQYNNLQNNYNAIVQRVAEVEMDVGEHKFRKFFEYSQREMFSPY